VPQVKTQIQ